MKKTMLCLVILCLLIGCSGFDMKVYLKADRATYNAISGEYRDYVTADPKLDKEAKDRRFKLLDTWKLRLNNTEKSVEGGGDD